MAEKEGLQTAVDFTKFLMTLAGAAIVFIIQPALVRGHGYLSFASLTFFSICMISGLFMFSGGCKMLADGDYNLDSKYVKIPGQINVLSFAAGFLLLFVIEMIDLYKL